MPSIWPASARLADVTEGVSFDFLAGGLLLRDNLLNARTLGEEDVDVADFTHDGAQAGGLAIDVKSHLG